jgi:exosortase/archaeosortase family protein
LQWLVWQIETTPPLINYIEHTLAQGVAFIYRFVSSQFIIVENKLIHSDSLRFIVVDRACTALSLTATLWAAFFALPVPLAKKITLAIVTVILLQIENSFRIAHLFYEVKQIDNNFDFFHLYFWQLINVIFAIFIFMSLSNRSLKYLE